MIQVIPAIDIIEGKCVRLSKGDYNTKKVYNEKPLEVAKKFEAAGVSKLHLVDLDGAKSKKIVNWKILELIANKTNLQIDFGGGLKSNDDLQIAFDCGAQQVTGGSVAVKDPALFGSWLSEYGSDRIILGADAKNEKIAISGWIEESTKNIFDFITDYVGKGVEYCISTDIDKDGMLAGASHELYARILKENSGLKLIASGGVVSLEELNKLDEIGLYGAIVGKAFYEGNISLKDLENYMLSC